MTIFLVLACSLVINEGCHTFSFTLRREWETFPPCHYRDETCVRVLADWQHSTGSDFSSVRAGLQRAENGIRSRPRSSKSAMTTTRFCSEAAGFDVKMVNLVDLIWVVRGEILRGRRLPRRTDLNVDVVYCGGLRVRGSDTRHQSRGRNAWMRTGAVFDANFKMPSGGFFLAACRTRSWLFVSR